MFDRCNTVYYGKILNHLEIGIIFDHLQLLPETNRNILVCNDMVSFKVCEILTTSTYGFHLKVKEIILTPYEKAS